MVLPKKNITACQALRHFTPYYYVYVFVCSYNLFVYLYTYPYLYKSKKTIKINYDINKHKINTKLSFKI